MKSAKVFLAGMYLHLLLSVVTSIVIFTRGWSKATVSLFIFYIFAIIAVGVTGWVCVASAARAYKKELYAELKKALKLLKIYSVPFYAFNFIYSYAVWFLLIGASRGLMGLLLPIPVIITNSMILQSGITGCCYVKYLRNKAPNASKPKKIHYILQITPVLDVLSSIILLKKHF